MSNLGTAPRRTNCEVCGQTKLCEYCKVCKAWICSECKFDVGGRFKAFLARHGLTPQQYVQKVRQGEG
jgi:hypothetical protein